MTVWEGEAKSGQEMQCSSQPERKQTKNMSLQSINHGYTANIDNTGRWSFAVSFQSDYAVRPLARIVSVLHASAYIMVT